MKILKSPSAGGVFIAVPAIAGVSPETLSSLFDAKEVLLKNGVNSELAVCAYDCHVDDQRNSLVREFLESSCQTFVFIDSDLRFDPEDLLALIRYDRDVVAGVYPKKSEDRQFPVRFLGGEIWSDSDGLIEVESVPTGFLKIRRSVFERMYESVPRFVPPKDIRKLKVPLIFERTLIGNVRRGGDVEFCRKWRALGGKIYVDPNMQFEHVGQKDFTGSLAHYLRAENGLVDSHIAGIITKIKNGTATPKDYISLHESWDNDWTPPVEMLSILPELASGRKILEAGSGLTTLILAATGWEVTSLEHDLDWYRRMTEIIGKCGIDNATLVKCDLVDGWYDVDLPEKYSMVLVDGPPRKLGDRRRVINKANVTEDCLFVVDDCDSGLNITPELAAAYNAKFVQFGRFAVGKTNEKRS
jgi:hypothetical protein